MTTPEGCSRLRHGRRRMTPEVSWMNTHYFTRADTGAPLRAPEHIDRRPACSRPSSSSTTTASTTTPRTTAATAATRDTPAATPPSTSPALQRDMREAEAASDAERIALIVLRNHHRWRLEYAHGEEREVVSVLLDLAADPECPIDWFDAALLSYDVIRRAAAAGT